MHNPKDSHDSDLDDRVRAAVAAGDRIRETVRDLVIAALTREPMTADHVRAVSSAVLDAVATAAPGTSRALKEAAEGVDDALERAGEASRLAMEEARARAGKFTETDLKRAAEDFRQLEGMTQEVLASLARSGSAMTRGMVEDMARHMRRASGDSARTLREALEAGRGKAHLEPGDLGQGARTGFAAIAAIGSGILAGMSEALARRPGHPPPPADGE
ncbi:DUF6781 family protein [Cereibacter sphaeroides]|uniref:DUF6781 family protein n=1 Tax=Cereibacter sphaeroides TaxID=1063 RepID=UPI001F2E0EEE|nr:DUF6781 family protein [Cereibacter sphaeroides]MCE6970026.1 hypothetical protein [Cereibacter sphaeroides]